MANLLHNLLSKIPAVRRAFQQSVSDALEQLYDKNNIKGGLVPGKFYQLIDPGNGNVKGFSAVCHCGQEYRMLSFFETHRQGYKCKQCGMEINLLKHVGAINAEGTLLVKAHELEALLSRLPVRPASTAVTQPPFLQSMMAIRWMAWQRSVGF